MAYQAGAASNQTDLMNKLQVFAAANGFVVDNYDGSNRFLSISRPTDNLYVTFYWDSANNLAVYQALGYAGASAQTPWTQANDSGNGNTNIAQIYSGRNVNDIGAGPYTSHYFFAYTDPYALHVVLEFAPGLYRHFGFGSVQKVGTWVGGAFAYGHHWNAQHGGVILGQPASYPHSLMLDGNHVATTHYYGYSVRTAATLHCEGLPDQPAGGKWGVCAAPISNLLYDDTAGVERIRIVGGCRASNALSQFGHLLPDKSNGFIPIIPFEVFYTDSSDSYPPNGWYYLGRMANVGHIHLHGIDPAEELTVGAATWVAFPGVRKSQVVSSNQETWNMGIIYRKDV